jgi:hypothetical protein
MNVIIIEGYYFLSKNDIMKLYRIIKNALLIITIFKKHIIILDYYIKFKNFLKKHI